jgi:hypothetical protein
MAKAKRIRFKKIETKDREKIYSNQSPIFIEGLGLSLKIW